MRSQVKLYFYYIDIFDSIENFATNPKKILGRQYLEPIKQRHLARLLFKNPIYLSIIILTYNIEIH